MDIQSLTIHENQEDPLLQRVRASITVTLLWNTKMVNISTIKIISMTNTIKSLISLRLRFLTQKFIVINKWAIKITTMSLARKDIMFSRGFKFLYEK